MPKRKGVQTRTTKKIKRKQPKGTARKSSKRSHKGASVRKSSKSTKQSKIGTISFSDKKVIQQLARQENETKQKQAAAGRKQGKKQIITRAKTAVRKLRVNKKKDAGKLLFISSGGKRNPHYHGYNRKGYLVYVTKTGKKKLVKQNKYGYKATSFPNLRLPSDPKLALERNKILLSRRKRTLTRRVKKPLFKGQIVPDDPENSFASDVVQQFFDTISEVLERRRGEKKLIIELAIKAREIPQPIMVAIDLDGFEFERQGDDEERADWMYRTIWREISNTLAAFGFVTSGSANHIRSLPINKGKDQTKWLTPDGQEWPRRHKEIITIEVFEWKIDEVKFHKTK